MRALAGGAERIKYRIGPFNVIPGQNSIGYAPIIERPQVDGYITRIRPDLTYLDGRVPRCRRHPPPPRRLGQHIALGQLGLRRELFFAAGEEKTILQLPKGYGYPLKATDGLAPQPHDPQPHADRRRRSTWSTRSTSSPRARRRRSGIRPVRPIWMDVQSGSPYPVFNVRKGSGREGRFTYPRDAKNPYGGRPEAERWVVDTTRRAGGDGGTPPPGRPPHRPEGAPSRPERARPVPLGRQVLRAGGSGVVGRRDDRHSEGLAGQGPQGRRALDQRDLRQQAGLLVGVDGHHGRLHG